MPSLIDNVRPFLEPDEQVGYVLVGQTGLNPALRWLTSWLIVANKPRIVAVTDRRIAVFKAGQWSRRRPRRLLCSLPRHTRLEHGTRAWSKVVLGSEGIWLSRKLYPFIDAANAAVGQQPVTN